MSTYWPKYIAVERVPSSDQMADAEQSFVDISACAGPLWECGGLAELKLIRVLFYALFGGQNADRFHAATLPRC